MKLKSTKLLGTIILLVLLTFVISSITFAGDSKTSKGGCPSPCDSQIKKCKGPWDIGEPCPKTYNDCPSKPHVCKCGKKHPTTAAKPKGWEDKVAAEADPCLTCIKTVPYKRPNDECSVRISEEEEAKIAAKKKAAKCGIKKITPCTEPCGGY